MKQIDELQDCLDGVNHRMAVGSAPAAAWTQSIKEALAQLGREKRYWVYAAVPFEPGRLEPAADGEEWLYDLVWLSYSDNRLLVDVELALESEWGNQGDVLEDFQKLCQARARFKVMLYQVGTEAQCQDMTALLRRQRVAFARRDPTETWLLSCWVAELRGFRHFPIEAG